MDELSVVFFSKTGNVKRFIEKLNSDIKAVKPEDYNGERFILVTYTSGMGEVPDEVASFLEKNSKSIVGVVGSGNKNWGSYFAKSAINISDKHNIPVMKFEMSGTKEDVKRFYEFVEYIKGCIAW